MTHQPQFEKISDKPQFYNYLDLSKFNLDEIMREKESEIDSPYKSYLKRQYGREEWLNMKRVQYDYLGNTGRILNKIVNKGETPAYVIWTDGKNRDSILNETRVNNITDFINALKK